jgi:hypothetical protein
MTTKIRYENGDHWVMETSKGTFEVYRNSGTHSVCCAIIGYRGLEGLKKAIAECDRREQAQAD